MKDNTTLNEEAYYEDYYDYLYHEYMDSQEINIDFYVNEFEYNYNDDYEDYLRTLTNTE